MDFSKLFQFLTELQQNNNKEWMDAHRKWYQEIRTSFIQWLDHMDAELAKIFGAGLDQKTKQGDFYIHIGVNECLVAGGYWKPDHKILNSIRDAIDYNGEELVKIITKKSFQKTFGSLYDDGDSLKKAPKGYTIDHKHIDLLRRRTLAVICPLTKDEILHDNFNQKLIEVYKEMLPFRRYLNEAVTV